MKMDENKRDAKLDFFKISDYVDTTVNLKAFQDMPMPKGQFVVMKTGFYPMKVNLKLFFKWGIEFEKEYEVAEHGNRKVAYAEKREIIEGIRSKYQPEWLEEAEIPPNAYPMGGQQQTRTQLRTTPRDYREVNRSG